ncbi:MAG: hypothetical protein MUP30_05605 [Deltaproteobacteria bacterium]|nr:hypothetical protein [Deltaproteobacteria bacterium]
MTASSYCLVSPNKKGHPCPWKNPAVIPLSTPEPHALFPFKAAPLRADYITALPGLSCFCPPSGIGTDWGSYYVMYY